MAGGSKKRKRGDYVSKNVKVLDESDIDLTTKVAAAMASPWVVTLVSRHVPDDMAVYISGSTEWSYSRLPEEDEIVFWGSGTIIECEDNGNNKYVSTIITAATLFERTNGVQPHQVKVDVLLSDGKLRKGQVLACDFHYNLAAVRIKTNSRLQTATLRSLDDALSINPTHNLQFPRQPSFLLRPHSHLFKVLPTTRIASLWRSYQPSHDLSVSSGAFRSTSLDAKLDCNELYRVKVTKDTDRCGGPVINCSGEVIGITFYTSHFLPVNIVSRWWKHFKSCGHYRRPWLGMEVANLHSSRLEFLEVFMMKFPNISTGVVVTKVVEDSPASCSGIRPKDVIVECNRKFVCSKLEFFEMLWDMVGEAIEVDVLRVIDGERVKLNLTVGETTPDNFYKWRRTKWIAIGKNSSKPLNF